jgi:hypothetical protein
MADDTPPPDVQNDDGTISVALSPMQLAAILENATIAEGPTMSNRIWGAVGMIGGAIELVGSAALLIDPDPTVSKVVGAIGLVHGADVYMTSWYAVSTGLSKATATSQAVTVLATSLGLDGRPAAIAGVVVDIAVPTGVTAALARSAGLFRLAGANAVRNGFISLTVEEQQFGNLGKASAHAIRDHVGKTLQDMLKRFIQKPSLEATASFRTIADAEKAVSQVLRANKRAIQTWVASAAKKPLTLTMRLDWEVGDGVMNAAKKPVGRAVVEQTTTGSTAVIIRQPGALYAVKTVSVVLNKTSLNGRTWYVLTAYPDILQDAGMFPAGLAR